MMIRINCSHLPLLSCIRVGVTQREGLYLICYYHLEILIAINDTYLEWIEPKAYLRICMYHLDSNFNTKFESGSLKYLICRVVMKTKDIYIYIYSHGHN